MRKWVLAATAAVAFSASANAAVITLESVVDNGGDFTFNYQGTLGPDEGVRAGDRLIIYDFSGYVDGSIFAPGGLTTSVEFTSPSGILNPDFDDDPNLVNLVFTYNGPDFRASSGPLAPFNFNGLGARSTLGGVRADAFYSLTVKNNPDGAPGGTGTRIDTLGSVSVPNAVPEPATWAMMIGGFGLAGMAMRRRVRFAQVTA